MHSNLITLALSLVLTCNVFGSGNDKWIILQADGVLFDTSQQLWDIIAKNALVYGYTAPQNTNFWLQNSTDYSSIYEGFRSLSTEDTIRELFGHQPDNLAIKCLEQKMQTYLETSIDKTTCFPHIKSSLSSLHKDGYKIGVLSAISKKKCQHVLENNGLSPFVDKIFYYSKHKCRPVIDIFIEENKLDPSNIVVITQSASMAKELLQKSFYAKHSNKKITVVGSCWGANNKKAFDSYSSIYIPYISIPQNLTYETIDWLFYV